MARKKTEPGAIVQATQIMLRLVSQLDLLEKVPNIDPVRRASMIANCRADAHAAFDQIIAAKNKLHELMDGA